MKLHFKKVKEGQIKITVCRKGCCDKDKWIWNVDEPKINKSEWNEVKADEGKNNKCRRKITETEHRWSQIKRRVFK